MSASFIVLGIVNFVLSMVGSFGCSMMYFPTYPVQGIRGVPSDNLGPWTYEGSYVTCDGGFNCVEGYVCYGYGSGSTFDSAWTAGRAFSMMAGILAIINFVLICCFACLSFPPKMFTVVAGLCIFNGVVQLISLVRLWLSGRSPSLIQNRRLFLTTCRNILSFAIRLSIFTVYPCHTIVHRLLGWI